MTAPRECRAGLPGAVLPPLYACKHKPVFGIAEVAGMSCLQVINNEVVSSVNIIVCFHS